MRKLVELLKIQHHADPAGVVFRWKLPMTTVAENLLGVVLPKELEIGAVFFAVGFFLHSIEQAGGGEGDRDSIDLADDLVF